MNIFDSKGFNWGIYNEGLIILQNFENAQPFIICCKLGVEVQ